MNAYSKKFDLIEMKCENCGATLRFDASNTIAVCDFCNTNYTIKKNKDENTFNIHDAAIDRECVKEKGYEIGGKRKVNKNSEAYKLGYELGKAYGSTLGKNRKM